MHEPSDDLQRRRKPVASSPQAHHSLRAQAMLFNPDSDAIPMHRTVEPEVILDMGNNLYTPRNTQISLGRGPQHDRLFDHRKDDPVHFHVLRPTPTSRNRPTPTSKSSGDYVSASSTSSYVHSIASSNFTLNTTTDGSSASSALFGEQPRECASLSAFTQQLKKLYRGISNLEACLLKEDGKEAADEGV